jgi:hypothetical protein
VISFLFFASALPGGDIRKRSRFGLQASALESLEVKKFGAASLDAQKKLQGFVRRDRMPRIAGRLAGPSEGQHNYQEDTPKEHQVCGTESVHSDSFADIMPN